MAVDTYASQGVSAEHVQRRCGAGQRWLEFLTAFDHTLEYRKGSVNGNADFLSRLLEPARKHDRNGSTSLTPVEDGGIYLIGAFGLDIPSSPIPGVGLGGLMPRTESTASGGLPFNYADVCDFRAHGPRMMRVDDLAAPSRGFAARVFASVSPPGRGWASRAADNNFASVCCTHRDQRELRRSPGYHDVGRPTDSFQELGTTV